jgi:ATP-dependent DNA ligase
METPFLFQRTKIGAIYQWRAYTKGNIVYTEYGQIYGLLQTTPGTPCIATNVGKSNERNPEQQAEFEAESMYRNQLRLKYSKTIDEAKEIRIQPMLAQDGKKAKLPSRFDVQRKFDGARAMKVLIDGEQKILSRGNKIYSVKHIEDELKIYFPADMMLDGEFYIHGMSLQKILSLVKRPQPDSLKLEYHIYDAPSSGTWSQRKRILNSYHIPETSCIKIVQTYNDINTITGLTKLHDQFIEEGYEGAIIRLDGKEYEFGKRSSYLLKWKNFEDAEFKIIGIETGSGKMQDCAIFICQNNLNDKTFKIVPVGSMETRKLLLDEANIGKLLTVRFLGRSDDLIPKIATGRCIRSIEDLPEE